MRSRTLLNLVLLGVVAILVLIVALEPGKETPPEKARLTSLKQTDVTHILIQRDNGSELELEKADGHWWLRKPYNLPANSFRADSAAKLVEDESYSQHVFAAAEASKYQLDKPALRITFNHATTVSLGGNAPLQQRRYAQVGEVLHTINDSYNYSLGADATAFVSYALLPPESKVTRLKLPDFVLAQDGGEWKAQPAQTLTSGDDLNELIAYWENAQSLEVFALTDKTAKGKRIQVSLSGQDRPLEFILQQSGEETSLLRPDIGIAYRLSPDSAAQLLSLPKAEKDTSAAATPAAPK